jgi:TonB family protein
MNRLNKLKMSFFIALMLFVLAWLPCQAQQHELQPIQNYGGRQQLNQFIAEEMVYPTQALRERIQGTVEIKFSVTENGNVKNAFVHRKVHPDIDAEALRIFRHLLWEPMKFRGQPRHGEASMEVDFKVRRYNRDVRRRGYDTIAYPHHPLDNSMKIYKPEKLSAAPVPVYDDPKMRFNDFVMQNLVYPSAALRQEISGTVELFFVVERSGRSSNIKVLRSVGGGCNEEAIRLLQMMRWHPGILDGKAVRTEMTLSITFNLADYENLRYVPASNPNQF